MKSGEFCSLLTENGFNFFTGVPCTILKGIIDHLSSLPAIPYIPATREDEALGIAAGATLAGKKPVVLMQNSGIGNIINPLASLALPYKIPVLLLISWRGYRGQDAPEHLIMGKISTKLLTDIPIPVYVMNKENPRALITTAVNMLTEKQTPVAIMLRDGIIT